MANLITDLGMGYVSDFFSGALFLHKGEGYKFSGEFSEQLIAGENRHGAVINVHKIAGTILRPKYIPAHLPLSVLDNGFSSMAFPRLGYRCYQQGQILLYLDRTFSVRRGLHTRDIGVSFHEISSLCEAEGRVSRAFYTNTLVKEFSVFNPTNTPFSQGVARVAAGEALSFCINEDFACAPSPSTAFLELLYRGKPVGTVRESGNVEMFVPHLSKHWEAVNGNAT